MAECVVCGWQYVDSLGPTSTCSSCRAAAAAAPRPPIMTATEATRRLERPADRDGLSYARELERSADVTQFFQPQPGDPPPTAVLFVPKNTPGRRASLNLMVPKDGSPAKQIFRTKPDGDPPAGMRLVTKYDKNGRQIFMYEPLPRTRFEREDPI